MLFRSTSSYVSETVAAGFNAKWLLPRPQMRAIAEGSVIEFIYNSEEPLKNRIFCGLRNGEGFGELKIESIPDNKSRSLNKTSCFRGGYTISESEQKRIALQLKGSRYGEEARKLGNSLLSRIADGLENSSNFNEFEKKLREITQGKKRTDAITFCIGEVNRLTIMTGGTYSFEQQVREISDTTDFDEYKNWLFAALQQVKYRNRDVVVKKGVENNA